MDYSCYLVTDSTMIPEVSTFLKQVELSVSGGATIVQLREKSISTLDFIERAQQVHEITKAKNIPLIINDRIDIALAINAEGVHVGQDDMPAKLARQLIGPDKILGVSCSNPEEVDIVCQEGVADYIGIGTVFKTQTKTDTKAELGPIGVRKMLQVLARYDLSIRCVAIGGINHNNVDNVMYQCQIPGKKLDGVAVVSCIMAKEDPLEATILLKNRMVQAPWRNNIVSKKFDKAAIEYHLSKTTSKLSGALVHHITNNVVKNFSANVTLAIGASPIMSELAEEYEEFASKVDHIALVLNMGTPTYLMMETFIKAIQVYNKYGKHIIFDPVAGGATSARLECCKLLLNAGQISVIKGNVGEISAIRKLTSTYVSGSNESLMRGVDSIAEIPEAEIIRIGQEVSQDFRCVVVITGSTNYVIDEFSNNVVKIQGGSALMGRITGSGCSLGSTIGSFVAARADSSDDDQFNIFEAVASAVELYNLAGRLASKECSTPGTFVPKMLDFLYLLTK